MSAPDYRLDATRQAGPLPGERYLDVLGREIEVVEVRLQPHGRAPHVIVRVPWLSTGRSAVQEWVPKVWARMIAVGPLVDAATVPA